MVTDNEYPADHLGAGERGSWVLLSSLRTAGNMPGRLPVAEGERAGASTEQHHIFTKSPLTLGLTAGGAAAEGPVIVSQC